MVPRSIWNVLAGCLALFAFTGDIVADSLADATHGCAIESSHESGGCDDCAICVTCCHGTLAPPDHTDLVALVVTVLSSPIRICNDSVPDGLPARIDHPPQLT
jgi:hypothetical protein